ncbi:MAG: biopolymer transporter ExbD [Parvularculaceae bacterium]
MAGRLTRKPDDDEDVNVTPLLDIVFIMLIFFIVTSTFIKEPGVDILRPEINTGAKLKQINILVAVTADDEIWIDKKKVTTAQVKEVVKELLRETPKGQAVIRVDSKAKNGLLVEVLKQVKAAGVKQVNVATEEL